MIDPLWLLTGWLLPAALSALLWLAVAGWRRPGGQRRHVAAWAAAVGAGFFAGYWAANGRPWAPPLEAGKWLALAIVPGAVLADIIATLLSRPAWLKWAVRLLPAAAVAPVMLQPDVQYRWSSAQAAVWLLALGAACALVSAAVELLARRAPQRALPLSLVVVCGGTGLAVLLSGSLSVGQVGLSLAAVIAGTVLAGTLVPGAGALRGAVTPIVIALAGVLVLGVFYAELSAVNAVLLAIAPLGAWVGELPPLRRRAPWQRGLVRLAGVGLPVAIVLILAGIEFAHRMAEPSYYP